MFLSFALLRLSAISLSVMCQVIIIMNRRLTSSLKISYIRHHPKWKKKRRITTNYWAYLTSNICPTKMILFIVINVFFFSLFFVIRWSFVCWGRAGIIVQFSNERARNGRGVGRGRQLKQHCQHHHFCRPLNTQPCAPRTFSCSKVVWHAKYYNELLISSYLIYHFP